MKYMNLIFSAFMIGIAIVAMLFFEGRTYDDIEVVSSDAVIETYL